MTNSFFHGAKVVEVSTGGLPIFIPATSIIGLVGNASKFTCADPTKCKTNVLTQITSAGQAVETFGTVGLDGYTIPAALAAIFAQGPAIVYVVNASDATADLATVTDEAKTFDAVTEKIQLTHAGVASVVVKHTSGSPTYVVTTDYTVDTVTGTITRVSGGGIASAQAMKVSYTWINPALTDATDIVGTASPRTGMQLWLNAASTFGTKPKVLIAPGYNTAAVVSGLNTLATTLRGEFFSDVSAGSDKAAALATRATSAIFNSGYARGEACWPHLKDANGVTQPGSAYAAGVRARTDRDKGFWWSMSNQEVFGLSDLEIPVSFGLSDETCDANVVNAQGITTFATGYGLGIRVWGNRNLSFPASTAITSFAAVRRTADAIYDALETFALQRMDGPVTRAFIDSVREDVNAFLRNLQGQGAIIGGFCTYDPAKNTPDELAAGHVIWDVNFLPPPPCEQMEFQAFIDTNLFKLL